MTVASSIHESPAKHTTGDEPIAGYRLLEPLGRGGFGEVWKCEVVGGLQKAIKFVELTLNQNIAEIAPTCQELDSLQYVKSIRHPFLLTMERVEIVDSELVIIMELADKTMHDLAQEYRAMGLPGVARNELISFLLEAAEVLDLMHNEHDLQHLDIKPQNLFVVGKHVKVADFGLVRSLSDASAEGGTTIWCGVSPMYSAPELFSGRLSSASDQYSLAITFQELLTGSLPFSGKNARQMMMQHLSAEPDLSSLPGGDRRIVARALAKDPKDRFESCSMFLAALRARETQSTPLAAVAGTKNDADSEAGKATTNDPLMPDTAPDLVLPGYVFAEYLGRNSVADMWRVENENGAERLASSPIGGALIDDDIANRLSQLDDPVLQPRQLLIGENKRFYFLSELPRNTLWGRFQESMSNGLPGIPRDELLEYLKTVATALDRFRSVDELHHLGLNPNVLLLDGKGLRIANIGWIQYMHIPAGEAVGRLNARYAAPELQQPGFAATSDQYSLALIYAELLTGLAVRGSQQRSAERLNLDFLPANDRPIVARALQNSPEQRFDTCTEFIRSLETTNAPPTSKRRRLPLVFPVDALLDASVPFDKNTIPSQEDVVGGLIKFGNHVADVREYRGFRYSVSTDNVHEQHSLVQLFSGGLGLKLDRFREQWNAEQSKQGEHQIKFVIQSKQSFWESIRGTASGLEVEVSIDEEFDKQHDLRRIISRVRSFGKSGPELLNSTGPQLLESLRNHLQAKPELRKDERWPCSICWNIYPITPDLCVEPVIEGQGRDISLGGALVATRERLERSVIVYLQPAGTAPNQRYGLLANVVRVNPAGEGLFDVGFSFPPPCASEKSDSTD